MRRKTTNAEVRWHQVKHLLPRSDARLSATISGLVGSFPAGAVSGPSAVPDSGHSSTSPLSANPNDLLTATLRETSQQLDSWRAVTQAQADAVSQNTAALQLNTAAHGKSSTGSNILKTAAGFLGGGLGAMPLVSGLLGLFSGGARSIPLLPKYMAPPLLSMQNGVDPNGTAGPAVYDQYGMPRVASGSPPATSTPGAAAHVTVNVQAMDSRSFMDHSFEIARAVREAMLNLHSINDVVNEL